MIRPFTCLCLAAAFGSGLYLYTEKHRAQLLDRDIGHVIRATEAARQRTGMLRAEWALLNEPGHLQDMANRYLQMKTMAPTQFVQLADLATRLPPPEAPATATDDTTQVDVAATQTAPAADPATPNEVPLAATSGLSLDPPVPPPDLPPPASTPPPARKLTHAAPKRPPHPVALASRDTGGNGHDGALAQGTPLPLAAPQPLGARIVSAMAHQTRAPQQRPAIVAAAPSYLAPGNGSALVSSIGGHYSLPPPVPYGR